MGEVRIGDRVIIDTPEGRAVYRVSQAPFAVNPYDVSVLDDYGDARLTLTTCNPPFLATTRLIVVAKLAQWLPTGTQVPIAVGKVPETQPPRFEKPATADQASAGQISTAPSPRSAVSTPKAEAQSDPAAIDLSGRSAAGDGVNDAATVGRAMADEGDGWHLARLPIVLAVVIALCALGALYERAVRFFVGVSRWLVVAPLWAAGLLVLFKVLGLLLPADL